MLRFRVCLDEWTWVIGGSRTETAIIEDPEFGLSEICERRNGIRDDPSLQFVLCPDMILSELSVQKYEDTHRMAFVANRWFPQSGFGRRFAPQYLPSATIDVKVYAFARLLPHFAMNRIS